MSCICTDDTMQSRTSYLSWRDNNCIDGAKQLCVTNLGMLNDKGEYGYWFENDNRSISLAADN